MTFPAHGRWTGATSLDSKSWGYLEHRRCRQTGIRNMNRLTLRRDWKAITAISRYLESRRFLRRTQTSLSKRFAMRPAFPVTVFTDWQRDHSLRGRPTVARFA